MEGKNCNGITMSRKYMSESDTYGIKSKIMMEILEKSRSIASGNAPVFLIGEYGSGKCWIAKKIHEWSDRREGKFSRVNCYSMQSDEIEKNLYGYLSFTGDRSVQINRGLFEACDNGTIYFDGFEVLPRKLQYKVIETVISGATRHVGSSLKIKTNVRLIVSTYGTVCQNRGNSMRNETSIYEINPHIIFMPALRNRREDIPSLIRMFLKSTYVNEPGTDTNISEISPEALYTCMQYHWPGNVRQLKNAIRLASLLSTGQTLLPDHLPESIRLHKLTDSRSKELQKNKSFLDAEKNLIQDLLSDKMYDRQKIATCFGISIRELDEKIRKHKIKQRYQLTTKKERTTL